MSAAEEAPRSTTPSRTMSVDLARGLASLLMIQGHAFDGWASPEAKTGAAYAFTRVLATLPLPAFLLLAGAAMVLRLQTARSQAELPKAVRRSLILRGLKVLLYGYALSLGCALIDGGLSWKNVLRADVLHVIGLSIAVAAAIGVRADRDGRVHVACFARRALVLAGVVTVVCPWGSAAVRDLDDSTLGPLRYVIALWIEIPGLTRMPLVPLFAWLGVGAYVAHVATSSTSSKQPRAAALDRPRAAIRVGALGVCMIAVGLVLTSILGGLQAGRASPAVVGNVIELGGRALLVLALGIALSAFRRHGAPRSLLKAVVRIGRGSLFLYMLHLPFTYGRLGGALRDALSMPTAVAIVMIFVSLCVAALFIRNRLRATSRAAVGRLRAESA